MSSPLVLAVPTFNCGSFLRQTLESLNAQGASVCWWLQDGVSTDATVEIARSLARTGDVVKTEHDAGQADALNRAMGRMGGEIIGFINGDDCLLPGAADHVLKFFQDNPEVDLVYGQVEWMDLNGATTGTHCGRLSSLAEVLDIYHVWWNGRQWVQPEVFYRRSLWEKAAGFDASYQLAFDYDFWVRCFRVGARAVNIPRPLARFRLHAGQKSSAADRAADEIRTVVGKHLASGVEIDGATVRRLRAELSYDLYQSGRLSTGDCARPAFFSALLRNPDWLLCAPVRSRIAASLRRRSLPGTT
jgi:glycosyltransferase involved in cell wall biosynthesis